MRRLRPVLALLAALWLAAPTTSALAAAPRASFNDIEDEVMCVTCNVPLHIAVSAQADEERTEIKRLIAQGLTKQQVLDQLVADLGPRVLGDPPSDGFNVTTWLVPVGAIGGVALLLVLTLPRWRRRSEDDHDGRGPSTDEPSVSPADMRRLDEDLAATEG
ncbi:MAG: hypothetical protein JWO02_3513 [Solirubrobacterales bacterium]|nr:hypothetical protein [Solirubrobacterales bacterium]